MKNVTGLLRSAFVLIAAIGAPMAFGGVRFDFTAEAPTFKYTGRMTIDGDRSRADINSGSHPLFNANITLITRQAGTDILVIDHSRRTFFQRQPPPEMRGPLATAGGLGRSKASRPKVTKAREKLENGSTIERHTVYAEYEIDMDVEGEKLHATVDFRAEFDVGPDIEQRAFPWGLQYAAKTGFPRIDWAIADRIPKRLPLRQVVTVSRQIGDGPRITESFTMIITNVTRENVDSREFFAPDGYRYEEPVFSFGQ